VPIANELEEEDLFSIPGSPTSSFLAAIPEDYWLEYARDQTEPPYRPVSSNSDWSLDHAAVSPMDRFKDTFHRHEHLAMLFSLATPCDGLSATSSSSSFFRRSPAPSISSRPQGSPHGACADANDPIPPQDIARQLPSIHRYLCETPPRHERLALDLPGEGERAQMPGFHKNQDAENTPIGNSTSPINSLSLETPHPAALNTDVSVYTGPIVIADLNNRKRDYEEDEQHSQDGLSFDAKVARALELYVSLSLSLSLFFFFSFCSRLLNFTIHANILPLDA
jgi:hypothetical protein